MRRATATTWTLAAAAWARAVQLLMVYRETGDPRHWHVAKPGGWNPCFSAMKLKRRLSLGGPFQQSAYRAAESTRERRSAAEERLSVPRWCKLDTYSKRRCSGASNSRCHTARKETYSASLHGFAEIPTIAKAIIQFHQLNFFSASQGEFIGASRIKVIYRPEWSVANRRGRHEASYSRTTTRKSPGRTLPAGVWRDIFNSQVLR